VVTVARLAERLDLNDIVVVLSNGSADVRNEGKYHGISALLSDNTLSADCAVVGKVELALDGQSCRLVKANSCGGAV
jgi:hypothetical protein